MKRLFYSPTINADGYIFDIATNSPVAYYSKEELEARKELFKKSTKDRVALLNAKSKCSKGKVLNPPHVQQQIIKTIADNFNAKTTNFNFKFTVTS
jgi:uncharacterized protein YpuA (DUF1002 family)